LCHNKLLDSAKSLVTNFQLKFAKSSEILLKICYFYDDKLKPIKLYNILTFRLALTFNEHGLKMPVLANTLFGPQIYFSKHFEQRNCSILRFLYDTVLDDLFHMVACFHTVAGRIRPADTLQIVVTLWPA